MDGVACDGRALARVLGHKRQHRLLRRGKAGARRAHALRQPALAVLLHAPGVHAGNHSLGLVNHQVWTFKHALLRPKSAPAQRERGAARAHQVAVGDDAGNLDDGASVNFLKRRHARVSAATLTAAFRRGWRAHQARHLEVNPARGGASGA